MSLIKLEILLPLTYNIDDKGKHKPIEHDKIIETYDELFLQFGGYSANRDLIDGEWLSEETKQRVGDQLRTCWIICEDNEENIDYIKLLKERLMERFEQENILMYYVIIHRF